MLPPSTVDLLPLTVEFEINTFPNALKMLIPPPIIRRLPILPRSGRSETKSDDAARLAARVCGQKITKYSLSQVRRNCVSKPLVAWHPLHKPRGIRTSTSTAIFGIREMGTSYSAWRLAQWRIESPTARTTPSAARAPRPPDHPARDGTRRTPARPSPCAPARVPAPPLPQRAVGC
jgi:hypothetical protein